MIKSKPEKKNPDCAQETSVLINLHQKKQK